MIADMIQPIAAYCSGDQCPVHFSLLRFWQLHNIWWLIWSEYERQIDRPCSGWTTQLFYRPRKRSHIPEMKSAVQICDNQTIIQAHPTRDMRIILQDKKFNEYRKLPFIPWTLANRQILARNLSYRRTLITSVFGIYPAPGCIDQSAFLITSHIWWFPPNCPETVHA